MLVPTRELALQVGAELEALAAALSIRPLVHTVHGGVAVNPQMLRLRGGADALVATPGRLLDLVAHKAVALDAVAWLVLDEADQLLAPGFADELQRVLALLPARRQQVLCSATFAPAVQALADTLLRAPQQVEVAAQVGGARAGPPALAAPSTDTATTATSKAPVQAVSEVSGSAAPEALQPQIVQRALRVDTARRAALLRIRLR